MRRPRGNDETASDVGLSATTIRCRHQCLVISSGAGHPGIAVAVFERW